MNYQVCMFEHAMATRFQKVRPCLIRMDLNFDVCTCALEIYMAWNFKKLRGENILSLYVARIHVSSPLDI